MGRLWSLMEPHSAETSKMNDFRHEFLTPLETLFGALGALFAAIAHPSAKIRGILGIPLRDQILYRFFIRFGPPGACKRVDSVREGY